MPFFAIKIIINITSTIYTFLQVMIQYGNLVTRYYSIVTKNSNYISIQRNFPIERQNDTYSTFQRKGHTQRVILQEVCVHIILIIY